MAQYDGSIRINTQINTQNASSQLMSLENRIAKTADKIASLRSKMDALKDTQVPTQEYKDISVQIEKAEREFDKLLEKQEQMQREGKDHGVAWDRLNQKIEEIGNTINYAKGELRDLVESGKAFALGSETQEYANLGQQLQYAENDLDTLTRRHDELIEKQNQTANGYKELKKAVQKFGSLGKNVLTLMQKSVKSIAKGFKKIGDAAKKSFSKTNKSASSTNNIFRSGLKNILKYGLGIRSLYALVNKFRTAVKEGFSNMYNDVNMENFKSNVDGLRASLLTFKNAFAAAFRPLVDVVIPYIQKAVDYITLLLDKFGQLTAALTGQKTYTRAIKQTADAFKEEAEEAKETQKAIEGYLSPLDEINKYSTNKNDADKNKDVEKNKAPMFEEMPVDSYFQNLAEKIKDIFSQIFAPIKEAWDREGKFVMDSWKYALEEIWKLAKDIGRDFLEVWNQEATVNMLADMLHIVGDIGLAVGNLAGKFREAWNYNDTGLHILENIRDIFAAIVHNIREAADYTVEWTKTLDFRPLLQGVERLTASLVPFADFVSGTLADFYTQFILPLTGWVLSEEGLPRLLNILSSFMEIVDWEGLRESLKSLYQALEPYAEAIGTGLLDFIEKIKDEGAEFFNYLPGAIQRAADALKSGNLPAAFEEFGSIAGEAVKHAFNMIKTAIESINWGEIGTLIASFINGIDWEGVGNSLFGAMASAMNAAVGLIYNLITQTDWRSIGEHLGKSLSDAWVSIDWKKAGAIIGEAFRAFFDFIAAAIESIDWFAVGQTVKDFLVGIDWGSVAAAFFEAIGAAIGGLGAFLGGLISDGVAAAIGYFQEKIEECGGNIVFGIFKGINDAMYGIVYWIAEYIVIPFIDGFKSLFGIHSPSTVMQELGRYLIEGLLKGIKGLIPNVQEIWESMKQAAINIWNSVKESLANTWENIKQTAVDTWENIKQNLSEKWENLKEGAKTTFDNIKEKIKGSWGNIKGNVKESAENVKTSISDAWTKAKETTSEVWGNIKERAVSSAQSMASSIREKFGTLQGAVRSFSSSAQSIWGSAWEGMKSKVSTILNSIQNTITSVFSWISRTISSLGSSLRNLVSSVFSFGSTKTTISGHTSGRYSKIASPSSLYASPALESLSTMPIPHLATGAVIPANKQFLAVLGDQKHGTNIEAPLDTIKQASAEAVMEVLSKLGITGNIGNSNPQTIIIKQYLDGKQVAESVVKEGKVRQMSTGSNMFLLGTT